MKTNKPTCVLLAIALCCLTLSAAQAADDVKKEPAKKETAKKKEPVKKREPIKKESDSKRKSSIEWVEVKSESGELKKEEYKAGAKRKDPPKIEFEVTGPAFKVTWETKAVENKRGAIKMTVYKEQTRGEKSSWKRAANLGSARGDAKGVKGVVLGPGRYAIELDGADIGYTIKVEQATKAE